MSQPPNKKPCESTRQALNVFDTIDINTGRYFSLGVYPHLPHTPTTEPTEHTGHASRASSILLSLQGADATHSVDMAKSEDIESAGEQPVAQSAAHGGRAGGITVDDTVGGAEEASPVMEDFVLGKGHPGVDWKGNDHTVILQDSDEESPVTKDINPPAPIQGSSSETPDAGEAQGKWTKSR